MELRPLVKHFEGLHKVVRWKPAISVAPYLCPAGYWTQGYGHLVRKDAPPVGEDQADKWLDEDLLVASIQLRPLVRVELPPFAYDALTSFVFNLGIGRYRASTLRAVVNRGDFHAVPHELRKWVYGGGQKLPGLVLRREAEVALWLGIT